jgi:hypothetical protein
MLTDAPVSLWGGDALCRAVTCAHPGAGVGAPRAMRHGRQRSRVRGQELKRSGRLALRSPKARDARVVAPLIFSLFHLVSLSFPVTYDSRGRTVARGRDSSPRRGHQSLTVLDAIRCLPGFVTELPHDGVAERRHTSIVVRQHNRAKKVIGIHYRLCRCLWHGSVRVRFRRAAAAVGVRPSQKGPKLISPTDERNLSPELEHES